MSVAQDFERTRQRITKRLVDGLGAGETIWDAELTGFGVRRQRRNASFVLKSHFEVANDFTPLEGTASSRWMRRGRKRGVYWGLLRLVLTRRTA